MNGKVLVTGGLGNLGSYITKYLVEYGYDVYVLTRKVKNKIQNIDYHIIEADITQIEVLDQKLNLNFDYCVHLASFNEFYLDDYPKKALEINALGTRNLLEVLSRQKLINFIYFSTFHVYGQNEGIIDENSELKPKNDYATTHLFAEYYVKQFYHTHDLKYTILRLTNSYGCPTFLNSDKWYLVLNDLCRQAYENQQIVLKSNGKAKRDFIYMGDVANVVKNIISAEATNETYNLSSSKTYDILDLVNIVEEVYFKKFNKELNIITNILDNKKYSELIINNNKLKSNYNIKFNDKMRTEVLKIFMKLKNIDSKDT